MGRIIRLAVVVVWVSLLVVLGMRTYAPGGATVLVPEKIDAVAPVREEWLGAYFKGNKIGYITTRTERIGEIIHIKQTGELRLSLLGQARRVVYELSAYNGADYRLRSFSFRLKSEFSNIEASGEVRGRRMLLSLVSAGETRKHVVEMADVPYIAAGLKPVLAQQALAPGKKFRFHIFEPPPTFQTVPMEVEVEGMDGVKTGGTVTTAYRLKTTYQGLVLRAWIDEKGDTLKEESPSGYTLIREPAQTAKAFPEGAPVFDLLALSSVPVSGLIPDKGVVDSLTLRVSGIDPYIYPDMNGGRQAVEGSDVVIRREDPRTIPSYSLPYAGREWADDLKPDLFVQADHPKILAQAEKILAGETDALKAAEKIASWVHLNVRKEPVVSIPSAIEVLENRVGDCNEHTILYAALARSAGIPTRISAGVVRVLTRFYYHAWPEVYVGSWMAVDPTLGQFPADATHLRLIQGGLDKQAPIVAAIGSLRLEVKGVRMSGLEAVR